jgi:AIPR protein
MKTLSSKAGKPVSILFHSIRNISSPEDLQQGRTVYSGQLPIKSIINLPCNENVRGYLVEAEGKQRRTPTQVHLAIRETLRERPSDFSVLNGGVVLVAKQSEVDEKTRTLTLHAASIINGSQTQGEVRQYIDSGGDGDAAHIKFELIVIDDDDLVADISIARNFQNDVQLLSIAGRKGELDDLEKSLQKLDIDLRLQKSESQRPNSENDVVQTEKLLQVIAALLPPELWWKQGDCNKTYTYSAKATCLKDFRKIHDGSQESGSPFKAVYEYYLDIAPVAWKTYLRWKRHQGFQGTGLRSIERDGKEIVDVPDGIIFPILASLSKFVVRTPKGWVLKQPPQLADEKLIGVAKQAYQEIAKHKPEIMGKTKACYSQLETITSIYKELLN